jgi:hypothetical protein
LDALKVDRESPHGQHFTEILLPLLALKPLDLRTQVAAAVLEYVDFGDTAFVIDHTAYENALAHGQCSTPGV